MVTDDLDSLTRSFTKQGFLVTPRQREPVGILADEILLPNRTSVILENPSVGEIWRTQTLESLGRPFVSELRFNVRNADSIRRHIQHAGIGVILLDSNNSAKGFMIDSTIPLVLTFTNDTVAPTSVQHPRGYYRIDWVILGASQDVEERLRVLFDVVGFRKDHQGCCDYWRAGSSQDFTYVRFETPQAPWRGEPMWLSLGKNALYFAYH